MIEDLELNALVREALEEGGTLTLRSRRPVWVWGVSSLLAASMALVVVIRALVPSAADPLSDAIALLSEADGVDQYSAADGAALLAAWQEAPLEACFFVSDSDENMIYY